MKNSLSILLLTIIVLLLLNACATPSQILADAKVRELCKKNGGIKVYETVKLPAERFDERGSVRILEKSLAKPEDEYYYESSRIFIRKGSPEVWRSNYKIYRKHDNKLLGESILYARVGGDMPSPWHPSSFSCPKSTDLSRHIFVQSSGE